MKNPLTVKLSRFADVSADDAAALDWLCADVQSYRAKADLIRQGDRPELVFLLIEGWAMRYKLLPDGRRHITAFLVPGDLCDQHVFILKEMDHNIGLLTDAVVALIPKEKMLAVIDERPKLTRALWWASLVDDSILREWLVNIGQRGAYGRISHFLVEMWLRLQAVGLTDDNRMELPLTQTDIADTMGLTPVHVNRTLQQMRRDGVIELRSGKLHIPDVRVLMEASDFDPHYLHLERRVG